MKSAYSRDEIRWWVRQADLDAHDTNSSVESRLAIVGESLLVDYYVVPDDYFQIAYVNDLSIHHQVICMTGEDPAHGHFIGLRRTVPTSIRDYVASAEFLEFVSFGRRQPKRALFAEQGILGYLEHNDSLRIRYLEHRIAYFDALMSHSLGDGLQWGFDDNDYNGFLAAHTFLINTQINS